MYAALRCSTISTHPYFISCVWYKVNERYCIRDSISTNLYTVVTILIGALCFGLGFYIFGGFVLHRDRKRNKVQARFRR